MGFPNTTGKSKARNEHRRAKLISMRISGVRHFGQAAASGDAPSTEGAQRRAQQLRAVQSEHQPDTASIEHEKKTRIVQGSPRANYAQPPNRQAAQQFRAFMCRDLQSEARQYSRSQRGRHQGTSTRHAQFRMVAPARSSLLQNQHQLPDRRHTHIGGRLHGRARAARRLAASPSRAACWQARHGRQSLQSWQAPGSRSRGKAPQLLRPLSPSQRRVSSSHCTLHPACVHHPHSHR